MQQDSRGDIFFVVYSNTTGTYHVSSGLRRSCSRVKFLLEGEPAVDVQVTTTSMASMIAVYRSNGTLRRLIHPKCPSKCPLFCLYSLFKASKLELREIAIDPEDNIVVAGSIHGWCMWDSYNVSSNDLHGVVVWMDSEGNVTHYRVFPSATDYIEFWSIAMDNYVIICHS